MNTLLELTPEETASYANLQYILPDEAEGITRRKFGTGFAYYHPNGNKVEDEATITRINDLAIPPAYTDVWICPSQRGHLQAIGLAENGKTQYLYHPRWRQYRNELKFNEMIVFGDLLPKLREQVKAIIEEESSLSIERVAAAVVRMMDKTHMRVGNQVYADENNSYGATTLRKRHVDDTGKGTGIQLEFMGKSNKLWQVDITDPLVLDVVDECMDAPGYHLFKYMGDDGEKHNLSSDDVNGFLKKLTNQDLSAKYFRT